VRKSVRAVGEGGSGRELVSDVRQWVDLVGGEKYRCTEHKEAKM